jgi:hypothetical protein
MSLNGGQSQKFTLFATAHRIQLIQAILLPHLMGYHVLALKWGYVQINRHNGAHRLTVGAPKNNRGRMTAVSEDTLLNLMGKVYDAILDEQKLPSFLESFARALATGTLAHCRD